MEEVQGVDNIQENAHNLEGRTRSKSPTAMEHTHSNRKGSNSSMPPLASLEYLQRQRKGSITDPALHAHANAPYVSTHSVDGPNEALTPSETHGKREVGIGSKRKMCSDESVKEVESDDEERLTTKRRVWSRMGERGGGSGDISVIAGSPRVSNGVEFAWPSRGHHLADMENEARSDSNNPNPIVQNVPYPRKTSPMSSITFNQDRKDDLSQGDPSSGPVRALRSRSRPPSRQIRRAGDPNFISSSGDNTENPSHEPSPDGPKPSRDAATPYSRSPELRVSHKLAERKRRKEMKDLFDELREQLPADRGMKASKWEILSKAIDFVAQLKQSHQEMVVELDRLRHEMDNVRGGVPSPYPPGGPSHSIYGQGSVVPHSLPPPPPSAHQLSRPPSSQSTHFPSGAGPAHQSPNKGSPDGHRAE